MEVNKVQLARTIWLFDTQELNPHGVSLYPDLYNGLAKRYQFITFPKPEEIHSGASLYFKNGKLAYGGSISVALDFDVHADGLVASCRHSTEVANEFLRDCTAWLGEQLGIVYPPRLTKKRIYRDELIVQMNPKLEAVSEKLRGFSELLSSISNRQVVPTGATFGDDNAASPLLTIERRVNTPFEDNCYFSASGLPTTQHIDALRKFEEIMAG